MDGFATEKQLYERLKPALATKRQEIKRRGNAYLKEEDIWNYLKEVKWTKAVDLSLADMVNDILNTEDYEFDHYLKEKLNLKNRKLYFEETKENSHEEQ